MKRQAKRWAPAAVLVALLVGVFLFGETAVERLAYAATRGTNQADREMLVQLSEKEQVSKLFRLVAKTVKPAVVEVRVKKRVAVPVTPGMDDFMRRFFGDEAPMPGRPGPRGEPEQPGRGRERRQQYYYQRGLGSGVVVDAGKGHILTNHHVVGGADEVEIILADGRELEAEWVRSDAQTELAVVKVKPDRLIEAPLGDSDKVAVGDWVLAIGAPERLPQTVTAGIISAKGRTTGSRMYEEFLQTDAAINHGNSGGPLVNTRGEVIGINTAIVSRTGVNEGIGLAIPSDMARHVMEQLIETGKVVRGYLGVTIQDIGEKLAESFDIPHTDGALVTGVMPDSPADEAGMKEEDFIVSVAGEPVKDVNDLRNRVAEIAPGRKADVVVVRDGKRKTLSVKIGAQPAEMTAGLQTDPGTAEPARYGIEVRTLNDEMAERFGYEDDLEGVVITNVERGSDAADQGLRPGMVIDRVDGKKVSNARDFGRAVAAADGESLRLRVRMPGGGKQYVVISAD
jgi:serine protease Do